MPLCSLHSSNDLDPLPQQIGNGRVMLLRKASHVTHEFFEWRSTITKRLV